MWPFGHRQQQQQQQSAVNYDHYYPIQEAVSQFTTGRTTPFFYLVSMQRGRQMVRHTWMNFEPKLPTDKRHSIRKKSNNYYHPQFLSKNFVNEKNLENLKRDWLMPILRDPTHRMRPITHRLENGRWIKNVCWSMADINTVISIECKWKKNIKK